MSEKSDIWWCVPRVEFEDLGIQVLLDSGERKDVQDAPSIAEEVHDLFLSSPDHDRGAADYQVYPGDILVKMVGQVGRAMGSPAGRFVL